MTFNVFLGVYSCILNMEETFRIKNDPETAILSLSDLISLLKILGLFCIVPCRKSTYITAILTNVYFGFIHFNNVTI